MEAYEAAKVLGVSAAQNFGVVRHKFRKLAIKYHPDKSSEASAEAKFKKLSRAFSVLEEYQKNHGVWPIPSGHQEPQQVGPKPPPPRRRAKPPKGAGSKKKPKAGKRRRGRWREVDNHNHTQHKQTEVRDKSWRKRGPTQQTQPTSNNQLVHAEAFDRRMRRYFTQLWRDEGAFDRSLKATYGQDVSVNDFKQILTNHHSGRGPVKIEYTPYGRRVSWDKRGVQHPPPQAPQQPPTAPNQTTRFGNNTQFSTTTTGGQQQQQPPTAGPWNMLRVNPHAYQRFYYETRGTMNNASVPGVIQDPYGNRKPGFYAVQITNGIPHVNGQPCNIIMDSTAPIR